MFIIERYSLDPDGKQLYWSNKSGWGDRKSATRFRNTRSNLPVGGFWILD